MGSPPPVGSKKDVFKLRSNKSMVIALANTGKDRINRIVVIYKDQLNKEIRSNEIILLRIFLSVLMKFILPIKELAPAMCKEKITISTPMVLCPS